MAEKDDKYRHCIRQLVTTKTLSHTSEEDYRVRSRTLKSYNAKLAKDFLKM